MKYSRKLVLIPEDKYRIITKNPNQQNPAIGEPISKKIAETPAEELQMDTSSQVQQALSNSVILSAIAKQYRTKAESSLHHIQTGPSKELSWDNKGQLIINYEVKEGTHITDLIKDAMRSYHNFHPQGDKLFYNYLAKINVPLGLIGNPQRREEVMNYKQKPKDKMDLPPPPGIRKPPQKDIQINIRKKTKIDSKKVSLPKGWIQF